MADTGNAKQHGDKPGIGTEYIQGVGKVGERPVIMLDLTMAITSDDKRDLGSLDAQLTTSS